MKKEAKICLNAMVGNEEHCIERMLKSCYEYIDYWVIQCNGNDNTQSIIEDFFKDKDIPGFTYNHEWDYPGINRDHTLQTALNAEHGCDWILRMDADEQLEVDDDFDWSPINNTNYECFNITARSAGSIYYRTWFWNAKLAWYFEHDRRHETVHLRGGAQHNPFNLAPGFRHVITNDGVTWEDPNKFLVDAVELEKTQVAGGKLLQDPYHFWYIGKSYYDAVNLGDYPLGMTHTKEYARRSIFYFENYLDRVHNFKNIQEPFVNEMIYMSLYCIGEMHRKSQEFEKAISSFIEAEDWCPRRNESIVGLAECYNELGDYEMMKMQTERLVDPQRTIPFPDLYFLVNTNFYIDSGGYGKYLHSIACENS